MSNSRVCTRVLFGLAASTCLVLPQLTFAQGDAEQKVRTYFSDIPVMINIAKCESGYTEFNTDGGVLHGGSGDSMVGIFQINPSVHTKTALAMGYDLNTIDGNMGYARYLYDADGTTPWLSSSSCWKNAPTPTSPLGDKGGPASPGASQGGQAAVSGAQQPTPELTKDLSIGMIDPEVKVLQELLNVAGYTIADDGPGSRGEETTKFGALTLAAVQNYQCARSIACTGDPDFGIVDDRTRHALLTDTAGSTIANASTTAAASTSEQAQIAQLELQIAALVAILFQLQKQRGLVPQYMAS